MAYSVIVADDHALVRQGVKGAIDAGEEFSIAAEAADGIQAIIQVKKALVLLRCHYGLLIQKDLCEFKEPVQLRQSKSACIWGPSRLG